MHRLYDTISDRTWSRLVTQMDDMIQRAIDLYVGPGKPSVRTTDTLAASFSELAKLGNEAEPDYSLPYMSVAYALKYLPRRVAMLIGILERMLACTSSGTINVLDIGSGSDAAALALSLGDQSINSSVTCMEPSAEMKKFAACTVLRKHVRRMYNNWTIDDFIKSPGRAAAHRFSLIILSACMQYDMSANSGNWWQSFAQKITEVSDNYAALIAIEPNVKVGLLERLEDALIDIGWHIPQWSGKRRACCHDLFPMVKNKKRELSKTTKLLGLWLPMIASSRELNDIGRKSIIRTEQYGLYGGETTWSAWPVTSWNDRPQYNESISVLLRSNPCACSSNLADGPRHVYLNVPTKPAPYKRGEYFRHPRFGLGIVWACEPDGDDFEMQVVFAGRAAAQRFLLGEVLDREQMQDSPTPRGGQK